MAITRANSGVGVVLDAGRTFFQQKYYQAQESLAKYKVYRKTFSELSVLTDRDLQDLGIPRCSIKRLAMEAAYGC